MKKTLHKFLQALGDYFANPRLATQLAIAFVVLVISVMFIHRFLIATGFKTKTRKK